MSSISETFQKESVAIVTGGGSGLGRQICIELAKLGVYIIVNDINDKKATRTVLSIINNGGSATKWIFDVSNQNDCELCVQEIIANHGKIDLLICNAGKVAIGEFNDVPIDSWHQVMDTNFFGQLNMVSAVYSHMKHHTHGRIVFVSSIAGLVFQPLTGSYSASKHALVGLACSLYSDAAPNGIKVHVACPGYIDNTDIFAKAEVYGYSSVKIKDILLKKIRGFISTEMAARKILRQIHRNKFFIVFPFNARLLWIFFRLSPKTTLRFSYLLKHMLLPAKTNSPI